MLAGIAHGGVAGVLPREALREREVGEFLAIGCIEGIKRWERLRDIEFIAQRAYRATNAGYADRCGAGRDVVRIRNLVIDPFLKI